MRDVSTFLSWSAAKSIALGSASPTDPKRRCSVVMMFDMAQPVSQAVEPHMMVLAQ